MLKTLSSATLDPSAADGVGIAWAVSEALLAAGAPTLFATHFAQLSELAAVYPAAKAWHFDVGDVAGRRALDFTWKLHAGSCEAGHYGLLLAAAVGFPEEVLATAQEVVAGETPAQAGAQSCDFGPCPTCLLWCQLSAGLPR